MKRTVLTFLAAFTVAVFTNTFAFAEDKSAPAAADAHAQHHPEGQAKETPKDNGTMGTMNHDDMKGMMHDCMETHKDGKMCDHATMQKCEAKMGKGECKKMMKHAKANEKKAKK